MDPFVRIASPQAEPQIENKQEQLSILVMPILIVFFTIKPSRILLFLGFLFVGHVFQKPKTSHIVYNGVNVHFQP